MPRLFPGLLALLCLSACALAKIDAIIDQYDTFGSTFGTTDENSSTTGADTDTSSTGSTTIADTESSTAGAEASMSGTGTSTSETSTSDTSSSSSTGPAPFCGDGILDPDEDCDDMNDNPNDGCKLCARDRYIFASSLEWQGFKLDGLFGADQRCRMLAGQANLPNAFTYRAWLSDSTTPAADRILHSKGRYTLVNGLVVAQDWDALTSGTLEIPINVTEKSETSIGSRIWTGTLPNGQQAFGSTFCNDWSGDDDTQLGGSGIRKNADSWWSFFEQNDCGSQSALYCIEN